MKKFIQSSLNFLYGIFSKDSDISSKRITGVTIIIWCLFISTYVIWSIMHKKEIAEIGTVSTLITFAFGTGVSLLTGGTLVESLKNKKQDKE